MGDGISDGNYYDRITINEMMRSGLPKSDKAAIKYDSAKRRMELIPPRPLEDLADVLTHGASKYGDYNWAAGFKWSRVYGALQRHLTAWYKGEDLDPETQYSHLSHALCNIVFLLEFLRTHPELDDRPKGDKQ